MARVNFVANLDSVDILTGRSLRSKRSLEERRKISYLVNIDPELAEACEYN